MRSAVGSTKACCSNTTACESICRCARLNNSWQRVQNAATFAAFDSRILRTFGASVSTEIISPCEMRSQTEHTWAISEVLSSNDWVSLMCQYRSEEHTSELQSR